MNDNITTIVVGLVSAGAGLFTVKLKGTNSNEKNICRTYQRAK